MKVTLQELLLGMALAYALLGAVVWMVRRWRR
jgi:flagellar biogenesis protein FliO